MDIRKLIPLVLAAAVCLSPHRARAQEVSLAGVVTDTTDARLPGVSVTALHVDTGNTFIGLSDTSGQYQISGLRTGVYKVTAELQGFQTISKIYRQERIRRGAEFSFGLLAIVRQSAPDRHRRRLLEI